MAGGTGKHGKKARKAKNLRYKGNNIRGRNKLKRVRQSNGDEFAEAWKKEYFRGRPSYLMRG